MKKIICLIMSVLIVTVSFSACNPRSEVPKEDVVLSVVVENNFSKHECEQVQKVVSNIYPEIILEFTILPLETAERESALQNMRAGIMSGQGADVFLLGPWDVSEKTWDSQDASVNNEYPRVDPLFESIEDAMNNGTFLVLDDYLKESEYFGPEKQPQIVMDAGKNAYGQMVLPLIYSIPAFLADKSKLSNPELKIDSLDAFLDSGEKSLIYTANVLNMDSAFPAFFTHFEDDNNNLSLTEEEFTEAFEYAGRFFEVEKDQAMQGEFCLFEPDSFYYGGEYGEDLFHLLYNDPEGALTVVTHNIEGGVTAFVEAFGAINANTQHPDEAFKFLEMFFSDEIQSSKGYYMGETDDGYEIYSGFGIEPMIFNRKRGVSTCYAAFGEKNLLNVDQVKAIDSMITHARFVSEFDCVIADEWRKMESKYLYTSNMEGFDYESIIKDLYKKLEPQLKMIAAE